ncbi:hypothetical protein [Paraflavitalea speifideaquila]|uniref:hypothetical protein n=1 Tax=Paraflavitalea speifideaquila TaxID=3076558 RepID=UPI0028EA0612|nr:hypothetical protein [Paraflavitalea speifideiaquila]
MRFIDTFQDYVCDLPKAHTIRAGNRWKAGDLASLRVWTGRPYNSKQIEFAQVEVKKTWDISIADDFLHLGNGISGFNEDHPLIQLIAKNDGLSPTDFISWFQPQKYPLIFMAR